MYATVQSAGTNSLPAGAASCFDVVAIAASVGGLGAATRLLAALPADFPAAVLLVQHRSPHYPSRLVELLAQRTPLAVAEAMHGEPLRPGTVHVAPAGRHLLVAPDRTLAVLDGPPVQFVRPAADLLFASLASWVGERAIAVVLSGMQRDGAAGAWAIKQAGGRVIVQDAATCRAAGMPTAALRAGCVDFALPPETIGRALTALVMAPGAAELFRVPPETSEVLGQRELIADPWPIARGVW